MSESNTIDSRNAEQIRDEKAITAALERAVKKALILHKQTGYPIYIWENGCVVRREAEDIQVSRTKSERVE